MPIRRHFLFFVGLLIASFSGPRSVRSEDKTSAPPDLTNSAIEKRKAELDQTLQKRLEHINNEFSERQIFEAKMKDARIDFERSLLEEHKAFLDSLKSLPIEGRKAAWPGFSEKQKEARRQFYEQQKNRRREFHKIMEESIP